MPIYQSATYAHPALGISSGYDYSRLQNPTKHELEMVVNRLEHGDDALAFSTGMAATTLLFELFKPGDTLLVSDDLYGGTIRFFTHLLAPRGIQCIAIDTTDIHTVEAALNDSITAIFLETPTNPLMRTSDIKSISELAHQQQTLVIVDNTFLTPYYQNPLDLGADFVIHSATKYLGGHNDTLAGFIVSKHPSFSQRLRFLAKTTGSGLAPFDSWLILRGIKTLAIRMRQASENAEAIFQYLKHHHAIKHIFYLGDPDHPGYSVHCAQARGHGAMLSFEVDQEARAAHLLSHLQLIAFAESLGGVETLITYPITQTHADVDPLILEKNGINRRFLRLSVCIEHVDDLIDDLKQALESFDAL